MAQQPISFEWVVDEDPLAPWQGRAGDETIHTLGFSAREARLVRRVVHTLSLLLIAICTTAGAGLSEHERARLLAQDGIEFALNQENRAWHTRDRALFETLIDPNLDKRWRAQWRENWHTGAEASFGYHADLLYIQPLDGLIQATVRVEQPALEWWQSSPYRESRFYQRVGQGWLRSAPPPAFWGEHHSLETEHLLFKYREKDAEAVTAAAKSLERAYAEMYPLLGLEAPSLGEKLIINVLPQPVGRWSSSVNALDITSPLLGRIPDGQTEAEFLAYDVMGWFTYRAMRDASPGPAGRYLYRWPILVWGLRGWLRDDLLQQPTPWRAEAMRVFQAAAPTYLPFGLSNVTDLQGEGRPTREQVIMRYLAAESFVGFVADTYGRERLPDLVDALIAYGSWDQIIPTLFGHSTEKFVADWNIYLLEEYGATPAP